MSRYLLSALSIVAIGCAKKPEPPPPAEPAVVAAAAVSILAPGDGDSTTTRVVVRLGAAGVKVVPATGQRVAGEGHHHVFLDVDPSPNDSIIRTGRGIYHLGSGVDSLVLDSLAVGPHRLIAVFAGGDHLPMTEVRADTARFNVKPR